LYREEIVPLVAESLHGQVARMQQEGRCEEYRGLVTILSHNPDPTLLMVRAIMPRHLVIMYTPDKEKLMAQVMPQLETCCENAIMELVQLDRTGHNDNLAIMKDVMSRCHRESSPLLCDITGGKKIMSTQLGIIAHGMGVDLGYIDSRAGYMGSGVPEPGKEVLFIQKPDELVTEIEAAPVNKLRVGYHPREGRISYELDLHNDSRRLGEITLHRQERENLGQRLGQLNGEINATVEKGGKDFPGILDRVTNLVCSMLLTRELDRRLEKGDIGTLNLVMDEELTAFPWEAVLANRYRMPLPMARIPQKDMEFADDRAPFDDAQERLLLINGSGEGIDGFTRHVNGLKVELEPAMKGYHFTTVTAKSSHQLKLFMGESNPFSTIIYYGHAAYGDLPDSTGWICEDGSIFSVGDCSVFYNRPPRVVISNACQSARGELFSRNSFAYALLKAGTQTFIGTNWLLEFQRSSVFMKRFLEDLVGKKKSPFQAFTSAHRALAKKFGENDISLYNYVYYGK